MLARWLLLALGAELFCYGAGVAWLVFAHGWSVAWGVALMGAIALGWRVGFALATYVVAWLFRSPVPPVLHLSALALLPHVLREIVAMLAVYGVLQPFERLAMGPTHGPGRQGERRPVLFVHGYACNRAAGWALVRRLRRRGWTVWAATFEPVYGSIEDWVEPLARAIEALRGATGAGAVHLVAHSMGGLAVRAFLRTHGTARVASVVTLGSPHHGSAHARLGLGMNARQMEPGSPWLAALAADERGLGVPFVSIFSHHDNFVAPQSSAAHPAARNLPLAGVGHLTLLFSPAVAALVIRSLEEIG